MVGVFIHTNTNLLQLLQAFADIQSEVYQHTICRALESKETWLLQWNTFVYTYTNIHTYTHTHTREPFTNLRGLLATINMQGTDKTHTY